MRRPFVALAAALLFASTALPIVAQQAKVKLTVLVSYDVKVLGSHYVDLWTKVAGDLGYAIEFENPGTEAYKTKIKVALAAGELPDVFSVWGGSYLDPFVSSRSVLPVDEYLKKAGYAYPKVYAQTYTDGKRYVIPCRDEAYAVTFVNMSLLDAVGRKPPRTWDELLSLVEAVNAYNKANKTGYAAIGLGMKDRWVGEVLYTVIVNSLDREAFDKLLQGKIDMTDKVFVEAARRIKKLVAMNAFPNGFMTMASAETNEIFSTGLYALYPHQSSLLSKYAASMKPESFQVIAFPDCATPPNPRYSESLMNGNNKIMAGLCVSRSSKHPDEAAKLAMRFAEEANKVNVLEFGSSGYLIDPRLKPQKQFPTAVRQFAALASNADHLTSYWYAALDAKTGEEWRDLVQKLYAGDQLSPEAFVAEAKRILAKRK